MESSAHSPGSERSGQAEAFAGIAFAAIAADREIKDIELLYLQALFSRMHLFGGWTVAQYSTLFTKLRGILEQQGFVELLDKSIENLSPKLYQAAFAISVDLILADGIVRDEEEDFIYTLQQRFRIDPSLASQITRVIAIKNQC